MIVAVAVFLALPLVVFRGATLRRYLTVEAITYGAAWLLWQQTWGMLRYETAVFFVVAKLALFAITLATGKDVRWSANRAAFVAALVYALMVPAMTRVPIDGDEPFYLLITESLVHDRDLDLANQYRTLDRSATGRRDLEPQIGDPRGARGEQYSRHEPFLPLLMVPGYLLGGLTGAVALIALFGVLLVRSTMRLLEDEGIPDHVTRAIFPLFAFAPPVLFYAARIWPEVPAAFFFAEAVRGVRQRRVQRWLPAVLGLVLLKLRFVLIAVPLIGLHVMTRARKRSWIWIAIVLVPLAVLYLLTGRATLVHTASEFVPGEPLAYVKAIFGLALDGNGGFAFQAPFYLLGLYALTRWRAMPEAFRVGCLSLSLYLLLLLPRPEWYGGWAPPLRYIVVAMPILALGAAALWERVNAGVVALIGVWTTVLVAHGVAYPWRLFHIANGETAYGEWLSTLYRSDFSRLFPSFIRVNQAAVAASIALVVLFVVARFVKIPAQVVIGAFALVIAMLFVEARKPADVIEFEDAHVEHRGGDLHPPFWTPMRWIHRGGWLVREGDALTFLAKEGPHELWYSSATRVMVEIDRHAYQLPPTAAAHQYQIVDVPRTGRIELRCVSGTINLDRMVHAR